ncbi:MAG: phosphoadenosine phosphosulfate reductase family protein [Hydrogenophaga sp.]|nr:phosphoadenosine phosphosulfate reductase family protein [Hydrogenophaga sp.]
MNEPKHVVGLSGGKDSTALALWLVENEPRKYEFICNETGNELPAMRAHWKKLEDMLGQAIVPVRHTVDLIELCEQQKALPNFRMRWCTRILKIEPTIAYMDALPEGSVLYVGLRARLESEARIVGDELVIKLKIGTLAHAARHSEYFFRCKEFGTQLEITDETAFANSVVSALNREEEDGSTPITRMLDDATEHVSEQGMDGIEET